MLTVQMTFRDESRFMSVADAIGRRFPDARRRFLMSGVEVADADLYLDAVTITDLDANTPALKEHHLLVTGEPHQMEQALAAVPPELRHPRPRIDGRA
jgi:hypothetical protein